MATSNTGRGLMTEQFQVRSKRQEAPLPPSDDSTRGLSGGAFSEPWTVACSYERSRDLVNYLRDDSAGGARRPPGGQLATAASVANWKKQKQ